MDGEVVRIHPHLQFGSVWCWCEDGFETQRKQQERCAIIQPVERQPRVRIAKVKATHAVVDPPADALEVRPVTFDLRVELAQPAFDGDLLSRSPRATALRRSLRRVCAET